MPSQVEPSARKGMEPGQLSTNRSVSESVRQSQPTSSTANSPHSSTSILRLASQHSSSYSRHWTRSRESVIPSETLVRLGEGSERDWVSSRSRVRPSGRQGRRQAGGQSVGRCLGMAQLSTSTWREANVCTCTYYT
ncbi:hypothetical protein MPTK1_1g11880 [Marchantia polymorpha subsp. ruderalis]|uniref:Uncharacterized protein n=2 Tax=Marchantia polymorpha TaxID=3197 RepID=A0AAF6AP61_MARPO|nr:hypothetical protein MARPO_0014s0039 [Marchantia polymorpha]BBM98231.1 hypothetical protein Mp_1g11880 [Marchantia polymorpha subsp. ruderalis]|eukprot:PTQ45489.1 hypothetical protein MARPO_0014s0039 [Marchantia polymorpha]